MLPVVAVAFISQQAAFLAGREGEAMRTVDQVQIGAWLLLSVALVLALATGGFWFRSAKVRALMEDEVTRANRAEAFRIGFLATMAGAIAVYVLTLLEPVTGREAVHLLMSIGIAAALLRFGVLERRALKE